MPSQIPEGFRDDGSSIDSQIACETCGSTVTMGVEYGENYESHECYANSYDETGGVPARGF